MVGFCLPLCLAWRQLQRQIPAVPGNCLPPDRKRSNNRSERVCLEMVEFARSNRRAVEGLTRVTHWLMVSAVQPSMVKWRVTLHIS